MTTNRYAFVFSRIREILEVQIPKGFMSVWPYNSMFCAARAKLGLVPSNSSCRMVMAISVPSRGVVDAFSPVHSIHGFNEAQ